MKSDLRLQLKAFRDRLDNKAEYDRKIAEQFISSPLFEEAETVLLYYSSGSEISTNEIFRVCLEKGKKVAFPVCLDKDGTMEFFTVRDEHDLAEGMYGIKAPAEGCPRLICDEKCLCAVPGLAFDRKGYRIGYGKGYYDRYLACFPGVSVGLCYDALLCEELPVNEYDIKVNYLITDKTTYNYNSKEDLKNG